MAHPTSAARPKRAADDFYRTHDKGDLDGEGSSSKKPRFDPRNPSTLVADARDPEEDLILDADVIGKTGPQIKRNAVNIDGYESDSDNDNFDARAADREKGQADGRGKSLDEEDDDMFADLKEKEDGGGKGGPSRKKDVRFLNQTEIEGQVMNSTSGGKVSSELLMGQNQKGQRTDDGYESESSADEEQRDQLPDEMEDELAAEIGAGGKKKHAPRLDAFNLKQEAEEGRYDESGNFVKNAADPDAVNDRWLDGMSRKDIKRAKEAHERREEERRKKAAEDDAVLTSDLLSTLIELLDTSETPMEALQRFNKGKVKARERKIPKWKLKKQQGGKMDVDDDPAKDNGARAAAAAVDPAEAARQQAIEAITGATDGLYSRGQHDIYDSERETLMRQYRRETGEEWQAPIRAAADAASTATHEWEYRWSDGRDGGETHGPYPAPTMKAWNEAGYFGEGVEFRQVGDVEWTRVLDVS